MLFKKIARWAGRRLSEKSTYVGLATVAVAVGAPAEVIETIGKAGQVAALTESSCTPSPMLRPGAPQAKRRNWRVLPVPLRLRWRQVCK